MSRLRPKSYTYSIETNTISYSYVQTWEKNEQILSNTQDMHIISV